VGKSKQLAEDIEGFEGFPERLQQLADQETLRGLAEKTGIAHTTLLNYQKGSAPGMDKLIAIVKGTGVSFRWLAFGKGPMYLDQAGMPDSLLAPQRLKSTMTDMLTVFSMVEHFEAKIRKKGKPYKPKQVASAITLLCILGYMDISKQDSSEIIKLIENLDI